MQPDRYWVALFKDGGERAGVERELGRCCQLEEAYSKYKEYAALYSNRLVMLCDRARVLARSDRIPLRRVAWAVPENQSRPLRNDPAIEIRQTARPPIHSGAYILAK